MYTSVFYCTIHWNAGRTHTMLCLAEASLQFPREFCPWFQEHKPGWTDFPANKLNNCMLHKPLFLWIWYYDNYGYHSISFYIHSLSKFGRTLAPCVVKYETNVYFSYHYLNCQRNLKHKYWMFQFLQTTQRGQRMFWWK